VTSPGPRRTNPKGPGRMSGLVSRFALLELRCCPRRGISVRLGGAKSLSAAPRTPLNREDRKCLLFIPENSVLSITHLIKHCSGH